MSKKPKRKRAKEPLHYDPPFEYEDEELPPKEEPAPKYRIKMAYVLDQEEVNRLIEASSAPLPDITEPEPKIHFSSYTEEEVNTLLNGDYKPPRKAKKKK